MASTILLGDALARRNALALATAQALAGSAITILFATGSIVGATLAPEPAWATAPISVFLVGMALSTAPVGALTRRYGRGAAFIAGSSAGTLGGALASLAIVWNSFSLFLCGAFATGFQAAVSLTYRFAATDGASDSFRARAISYVLVAGVASAVIGPQAVHFTMDLGPAPYAASYLAQGALALAAMAALVRFRAPQDMPAHQDRDGAALALLRRPAYAVAVLCGLVAYTSMNLVMTAAPLAMTLCGHSAEDANLGIQWHVLGMYAPSFFSGGLVSRYGAPRMILAGMALLAGAALVHLSGIELWRFWAGLVALGVGWNFAFVGATTLVVESVGPEERAGAQSLNDLIIFGAMTLGSLSSGGILAQGGWSAVNATILPAVAGTASILLWRRGSSSVKGERLTQSPESRGHPAKVRLRRLAVFATLAPPPDKGASQ